MNAAQTDTTYAQLMGQMRRDTQRDRGTGFAPEDWLALSQIKPPVLRSGVSTSDRARASFGADDEERANILRKQGYDVVPLRGGGFAVRGEDGQLRPMEDTGWTGGDIADVAGEVPSVLLGVLGGKYGGIPGAAGGAILGEVMREATGNQLGSGRTGPDLARMAWKGAEGAAGEGLGRLVGKVATGPARRAAQADDAVRLMKQIDAWDARYGTNLKELVPVDVATDSDFWAMTSQRVRESPFGRQRMREKLYTPWERERTAAMDALLRETGADQSARAGPYAERVGERAAGRGAREALEETMTARSSQLDELYTAFRGQIDETAVPDLTNTVAAVRQIEAQPLLRRGKTGGAGLDKLRDALEEAKQLDSFEALQEFRRALADEIKSFDPTQVSHGAQARLKRLGAALAQDEEAFLMSGGGTGTDAAQAAGQAARGYARTFYQLDEAKPVRRLLGDEMKMSEMPERLAKMNADEVRAIKQALGAEPAGGGVQATDQGMAAWQRIGAEVLDDLREKAVNRQLSTADETVLSGDRLWTALDRFKPEALEEVVGKETAIELRNFADILRNTSMSERMFSNYSRTGMATQGNVLSDLAEFFYAPKRAVGKLGGRLAAEGGAARLLSSQKGKGYLLGQLPYQERYGGVLRTLGRLGGQTGAQYTGDELVGQPWQ